MKFSSALPVMALLAFSTTAALAEDMAPPKPDWAARHAQMCNDRYADAVGKLATLEVRLNLTSAQKSAFERWKSAKLATVKAHVAQCTDFKPLGRDAAIMELRKEQIARAEARLSELKAETPALEALVKVLTPEQQDILKRAAAKAMGRMFEKHRFMDGRGPMMHRMDMPPGGPDGL